MTSSDRTDPLAAARQLLVDGFSRIEEGVPAVVDGLSAQDLLWRPDASANHVAWLLWHLTRQQDSQVAALGEHEQAWDAGSFADRFDLPYDDAAHGYGMSTEDVGAFPATDPALFVDYQHATFAATKDFVSRVTADDLERVIDHDWDPPVTVASRIVSVMDDAAKHLGQAEYLRGLVQRRET